MIDLVLTVVVAALGCALLLTVVVIWSIKRHRDPHLRIESNAPLAELLPSLSGLTHGAALKGNAVEILENGAFFEVMFEEIGRATRSVHFETFLWKDGMLGRRLVDALTERSRAGVTVRVLVDATGGREMGEAAGDIALIACFASSWTPAMMRRWHADSFGFLRPWNELPVLMGSAPPATAHSTPWAWSLS